MIQKVVEPEARVLGEYVVASAFVECELALDVRNGTRYCFVGVFFDCCVFYRLNLCHCILTLHMTFRPRSLCPPYLALQT